MKIAERNEFRRTTGLRVADSYRAGASIRQLAQAEGYSYGWMRSVLLQAGVTLRRRGGTGGTTTGTRRR